MSQTIEIKVPDIGNYHDVDVIEVLVQPGLQVAKDSALLTLETDKATMEVPSSHAGVVKEVRIKVGDKVSQGNVVCLLEVSEAGTAEGVLPHLPGAVTALQFQNTASQVVNDTQRRLRNCADRLARDVMGDDEDGAAVVEDAPLRPNPVTQNEMDAGSIELF